MEASNMIQYTGIKAQTRPEEVTFTQNQVIVAKNIEAYEDNSNENCPLTGFQYDCDVYSKDEYIQKLMADNAACVSNLQEELTAAKILLGVE